MATPSPPDSGGGNCSGSGVHIAEKNPAFRHTRPHAHPHERDSSAGLGPLPGSTEDCLPRLGSAQGSGSEMRFRVWGGGHRRPGLEGGSGLTTSLPTSTAHGGLSRSVPWGPAQGKGRGQQQADPSGCRACLCCRLPPPPAATPAPSPRAGRVEGGGGAGKGPEPAGGLCRGPASCLRTPSRGPRPPARL